MGTAYTGKDTAARRRFQHDLPSPVPPHPVDALLTEQRAHAFRQVLARRCRGIAVVIEECYDPHNATAAMRTCDIFGVHRVHCVASRTRFKVNRRVSQGAHKYLDLRFHADITEAYAQLRADNYAIYATDLRADAVVGPQQLRRQAAERPLALVFGSEGFGISDAARAGCDGAFLIPMAGFSQSLNLSVSVAVSLYALRGDALAEDAPGDLSPQEQAFWYDQWVRQQHGPAAERLVADDADYLPPPDPRARIEHDRKGNELETFGP